MPVSADTHLIRLADSATAARLADLDLDWGPLAVNACAALRFKRQVNDAPPFVGLIGGASSGKSTLFNTLLQAQVSRISAHAHETLGPVLGVPQGWLDRFNSWAGDRLVFPGYEIDHLHDGDPTVGRLGGLAVRAHRVDELGRVVLFDLPDVTSKMAADEGDATRNLLPWLDGVVVVVDEERWFDATVFAQTMEAARDFGPHLWVVFNRTSAGERLTSEQCHRLADHGAARHATATVVSPFQPGSGYRPLSAATRGRVLAWFDKLDANNRRRHLEQNLQRRCADLVRTNVTRGEQFAELGRRVGRELAALSAETNLSFDLLTPDERALLGLGRRLVPLYDALQSARRWWDRLGRRHPETPGVDFDKRARDLADVLRRNLEQRLHRATDRINRIIADSPYTEGTEPRTSVRAGATERRTPVRADTLEPRTSVRADVPHREPRTEPAPTQSGLRAVPPGRTTADKSFAPSTCDRWKPTWAPPTFDEQEWARRIRAHLDAWKAEASHHSRRGDLAALSVGVPLLLADLLFLGGAGLTVGWVLATVAGLVGSKSLAGLLQRSPAFNAYQTTVRAYQSLIRESLTEQWEANLAAMPRRHLSMSDPLLESIMYWAAPVKR